MTLAAVAALVAASAPAWAVKWSIYAPDEMGLRYWIDSDSIATRGPYTYFTWRADNVDSPMPASGAGNHTGINCATGESLNDQNGAWVAGPHYTSQAYLFRFVCQH